MKTEQLNYYLPEELIAQQPCDIRSDSKLLVFDRAAGKLTDRRFRDVGEYLRAGDCLVLNDTKVLQARFFARRGSGGRLEGLFLGICDDGRWEVMLKGSRKVKAGERIHLFANDRDKGDYCSAVLIEKTEDGKCLLDIEAEGDFEGVLEKIGYPPLPPYIKRGNDFEVAADDKERYQTVYAASSGAVAAPTAGLHFTEELMSQLKAKGVLFAYVTLHVGAGTFKPVTVEKLEDHEIHSEWFRVDQDNAAIINAAKNDRRRVIAVGTTSVRTLESAWAEGAIAPGSGDTGLFIQPGYGFKVVDAMVTNFHLPKSSLLALVGAFAGLENVLRAYEYAIKHQYRFYSYGDAMLIL